MSHGALPYKDSERLKQEHVIHRKGALQLYDLSLKLGPVEILSKFRKSLEKKIEKLVKWIRAKAFQYRMIIIAV